MKKLEELVSIELSQLAQAQAQVGRCAGHSLLVLFGYAKQLLIQQIRVP